MKSRYRRRALLDAAGAWDILAATITDFYTLAPRFRTKERLQVMVTAALRGERS